MEILNLVLAIIALLIGVFGALLTFITFFAPEIALHHALRSPEGWRLAPPIKEGIKIYRHCWLSGFSIEVDLSHPVCDSFYEEWMQALHRPDPRAESYYVTIYFNGMPVMRELFVQYDGGRNLIPAPLRTTRGDKSYLSFSGTQQRLANIVGYDHFNRSFAEVSQSLLSSRYNPQILDVPDISSLSSITDLQGKIDRFRSNSSILND